MLLRSFDERRKLRVAKAKDLQRKKSLDELTSNTYEPVSPNDADVLQKLVVFCWFLLCQILYMV